LQTKGFVQFMDISCGKSIYQILEPPK